MSTIEAQGVQSLLGVRTTAGSPQETMVRQRQRLAHTAAHLTAAAAATADCTVVATTAAATTAADATSAKGAVATALRANPGAYERSGQSHARGSFREYSVSTRDNTPTPPTNSFGVSSILPGLGILPRKVHTAEEAVERLRSDGAVILTGLHTNGVVDRARQEDPRGAEQFTELSGDEPYHDTALALPRELFGDALLAMTDPVSVGITHRPDAVERKTFLRENWGSRTGSALPPWEPNCAHTDGEGYGERYPPYLFLLFGHQSEDGGENALVDSYGLIDAMEHDSELAETVAALKSVPVDQTQYGEGATPLGVSCVSPMLQDIHVTAADGSVATRRMLKVATGVQAPATGEQKTQAKAMLAVAEPTVDTSSWDDSEDQERDAQMIADFKDTVFAASAHAPRFKVMAGEALIVDNYRALHIREAYSDVDRFSWRVWMWVDGACHGAPEEMRGQPSGASTDGGKDRELLKAIVPKAGY